MYKLDLHPPYVPSGTDHTLLLPVWKALVDLPKRQHLATLQRASNDTAQQLGVCAPIIATPSLLNMALALVFHLGRRDNLGMGMHQLFPVQNTSAAWKVMKACVDQSQVIAVGGAAPILMDEAYLIVPDGVTLPEMVAMLQSAHARLGVVLGTLLGRDHVGITIKTWKVSSKT